jgi:hypothetical protein
MEEMPANSWTSMLALVVVLAASTLAAQETPKLPDGLRTVRDAQDRLSFQVPANWPLATRDRELSTFHQEARTAPLSARVRYVAAMPENPFPLSTFSGAHFYLSVTPRQSEAQCKAQTVPVAGGKAASADKVAIAHLPASHLRDEHGAICTQFRDDAYTVYRRGACLRFDLAMNNFCGGEVSGVRDMSPAEMQEVRRQLETILSSVTFQP